MLNEIEKEIINRGLGVDFNDKIVTLESLVENKIWQGRGFSLVLNNDEVNFEGFSLNEQCHFIGNYFEKNDITIWCGYHVPYEYCIDFWSDDDSKKALVHQKLLQQQINVHEFYSSIKYKSKITGKPRKEEYWFSILIKDLIKMNLLQHGNKLFSSVVDFIDSVL